MRTTMILLTALALACGGSGNASNDETSGGTTTGNVEGSSTTSSSGPDCTPGTEGCTCDEGTCEGELSCFSEVCVMLPAESSSGGVETSTSSAASTSSESSSDDGSSSESSSSTGPTVVPCEEEGNHVCHDAVLDACTRGEVVSQSCDEVCAQSGYFASGCADVNGCACDGYIDANCETIMGKYCDCLAFYGSSCNMAEQHNAYQWCLDPAEGNHDALVCLGGYPTTTYEECDAAVVACF